MTFGPGQRALAVGAHPDDVEFGCAATLQLFDARRVVVLTGGERGGPPGQRRDEAAAAAAVIGADIQVLDQPDTALAPGPAITAIAAAIAEFAPDVVLAPSRGDDHQDHAVVAQACYVATRGFHGVVLGYLTPSAVARFAPQALVGVDEERWRTKLAALDAHRSQAHRSYLAAGYVDTTARYWGQQAGLGVERAEPFEVVRWVQPG
ncbi:MAG TPA: PIG-L family deacetylase [Acidimicrobiales bacterium]|nr:PIG-L family deacetylase [Acidimicrobiales bacterium]